MQETMTLNGHSDVIEACYYEKDGSIFSGADDLTAILWNASTGEPIHQFSGHTDLIHSVCQLEDGTFLSASWDHSIRQTMGS